MGRAAYGSQCRQPARLPHRGGAFQPGCLAHERVLWQAAPPQPGWPVGAQAKPSPAKAARALSPAPSHTQLPSHTSARPALLAAGMQ